MPFDIFTIPIPDVVDTKYVEQRSLWQLDAVRSLMEPLFTAISRGSYDTAAAVKMLKTKLTKAATTRTKRRLDAVDAKAQKLVQAGLYASAQTGGPVDALRGMVISKIGGGEKRGPYWIDTPGPPSPDDMPSAVLNGGGEPIGTLEPDGSMLLDGPGEGILPPSEIGTPLLPRPPEEPLSPLWPPAGVRPPGVDDLGGIPPRPPVPGPLGAVCPAPEIHIPACPAPAPITILPAPVVVLGGAAEVISAPTATPTATLVATFSPITLPPTTITVPVTVTAAPVTVTVVLPPTPPPIEPPPETPWVPALRIPDMGRPKSRGPAGIPCVGSEEWCASFVNLVERLVDLGADWLSQSAGLTGDPLDGINKVLVKIADIPFIGKPIAVAISASGIGTAIGLIKGAARFAVEAVRGVGVTSPAPLIGISALRTVLKALRNVKLGTDLAIWATADLEFEMESIERVLDYVENSLAPTLLPSHGEVQEMYLRGVISPSRYSCLMLHHGYCISTSEEMVRARREQPTVTEQIRYSYRFVPPEKGHEWREHALRGLGFTSAEDRAVVQAMHFELPTIQDHLHFLQRNVFDQHYVETYRLMEGFEEKFWPRYGHDLTAQGMRKSDAENHYAAHWIMPPVGKLDEALIRLRPDRIKEYLEEINSELMLVGKPPLKGNEADLLFSSEDHYKMLVEQDVAPYWRWRLRALAFSPFGLRFIAELYANGVIDKANVISRFRDIGYAPKDAALIADSAEIKRARNRAQTGHGYTVSVLSTMNQYRLIDDAEFATGMQKLGYTNLETGEAKGRISNERALVNKKQVVAIESKALAKTFSSLLSGHASYAVSDKALSERLKLIGLSELSINVWGKIARSDRLIAKFKAGLLALKRQHASGQLSRAEARNAIKRIQTRWDTTEMAEQDTEDILDIWEMEVTAHMKTISASRIVKYLADGMITTQEASRRLRNLGYPEPDILLLEADAASRVRDGLTKEMKAREKGAAAQAAALQKQIKDAEKHLSEMRKRVGKLTPISKLMRWLRQGTVSETYVRRRMVAIDIPVDIQDLHIEEAKKDGPLPKPEKRKRGEPGFTPPIKPLSVSEVTAAFVDDVIDERRVRHELREMAFSLEDENLLVDEMKGKRNARIAKEAEAERKRKEAAEKAATKPGKP